MSKNIIIQESGTAQTLSTISVVETDGADWVPEDECILGETIIAANGDYSAAAIGLYAFSQVIVAVPADAEGNKAVGKNEYGVWQCWVKDGNGILVDKGLPTRIAVVTPPTKTAYTANEKIDITGMVVKAYYSDDSEYGTIHHSQITIDPTTATNTTVTVKWNRDGDKQTLTTTFSITLDA